MASRETGAAQGLRSAGTVAPARGNSGWALALLTTGFGLNLLDRQIINILGEPIKRDLHLSDAQLGALSGLSFALLYSVAALPIARAADRGDRARIIGAAILAWSFFTAACGLAGSFIQMVLLRIGVGLGEAGGAPPSQSLIADRYPPERRAGALAIFSLGAPVGSAIGLIGGGTLAGLIGWRWTLACAGLPGLLVGALVLLTVRDSRSADAVVGELPRLGTVLRTLAARRAFLLMTLGSALLSFVNYGAMAFAGSFYLRNHLAGLTAIGTAIGQQPLGVVGLALGILGAIGGSLGTISGGWLGDRYAHRNVRALALIPAAGSVLTALGFAAVFTMPNVLASLLCFLVAAFCSCLWYGSGTLAMQRLAGTRSKATALAIALFINSAIGLSLGPLLIGLLSDALAPALGAAEGLRAGILIGLTSGLVSGLVYWLASRRIVEDIAAAERE